MRVADNLYNIATNPDHKSSAAAAMFWMKTRLGWRETNRTEVTGPDGQPLRVETTAIDPRTLSAEQRDQLRDILMTAISNQATVVEGTSSVVGAEDPDDEEAEEADFPQEFED